MKESYEKRYHELEKKHFWFRARREYIRSLVMKFPKNSRILDIGCSSGILINELKKNGFDIDNIYGIDISEKAILRCKESGIQNSFVLDAQYINLDIKFDVIIASDCLEHLKEDSKALKNWSNLLNENGVLIVFVPAFMALWSEHDVANLHYRRYRKKELEQKLLEQGFVIDKSSYWNFVLFIPVLIIRKLSNLIGIVSKETNGDLSNIPILNGLLSYLMSLENKLLRIFNFPFGISTFCIASKTGIVKQKND